ncbi:MAG: hypothetical protein V2A66_10600 [Pseudomonadota bacterium]
MKIKGMKRTWCFMAAVVFAAMAAGCDDGSLQMPGLGANITPPTPNIIAFSADPNPAKAGETTNISWEVANADSVEITATSGGKAISFDVKTTDLKGTAPSPALTATTEFTLTATKKAPTETAAPASANAAKADETKPPAGTNDSPSLTSVSQTITVTVDQANEIKATIDADSKSLTPGDQTVIRWKVGPADGLTIKVESDTGEPISATEKCDGDIKTILGQTPASTIPAVGCAVVAPQVKTTYTVTALAGETALLAGKNTASVVVDVNTQLEVARFTVNQQENAVVADFSAPVTLEWTVIPKGALVTIVSSPRAACDLPVDSASAGEAEQLPCMIAANTTFTLTAKLGKDGASQTRTATVRQQQAGGADLKITSDGGGWAFAGEQVAVVIEPIGNAQMIGKVTISNGNGLAVVPPLSSGAVTVKVQVPASGVHVSWTCDTCEVKERSVLAVQAMPMNPKAFGEESSSVMRITSVTPIAGSDGVFLYGVDRGYNKGVASIFKSGISLSDELMMNIDFGSAMLGVNGSAAFFNPDFLSKMDYPVGAIGVTKDNRIYVGTSGALMYEIKGAKGPEWKIFDQFFGWADSAHPYPGSHPTCAGETQKGNPASGSSTIATLHEFCDIAFFGEKGLMVATDRGVFAMKDADAYLTDRKANVWKGIPPAGKTYKDGAAFLTFSRVANDLQQVDTRIFAATSKGSGTALGGVFVTADNGDTWTEFGLKDTDVYSLAYDDQAKKLYAGTASGVQVSDVSAASSWTQVGTLKKAVFSLAVDPYSSGGVLVAGTADGLSVLRGVGTGDWVDIGDKHGVKLGKIRALTMVNKVDDAKGLIQHYVAIGTLKGAINGSVAVHKASVMPTAVVPETPQIPSATPVVTTVPPKANVTSAYIMKKPTGI